MICQKCRNDNTVCEECGGTARRSFLSRHKGLIIVLVLIFTFVLFPLVLLISLIASISSGVDEEYLEQVVISGSGDNKLALVNVDGIIVESETGGGLGVDSMTSERKIKKILHQLSKEPDVKGLILRVNSPGGSAVASEEIYQDLLEYKKKTGNKVTVYFSDLAASGGYYVSMAGDKIISSPSSITGSIGVIISYLTFGDLAREYGVGNVVYKSGPHKDIVSEFREPTEEEREIMQSIIDDSYDNFVLAVSKGRNMQEANVRQIADGRVYSAKQAQAQNLVDALGTFEDAVAVSRTLANLKEATVVEYGSDTFIETLLGSMGKKFNVSLLPLPQSFLNSQPGPRVLYLYSP